MEMTFSSLLTPENVDKFMEEQPKVLIMDKEEMWEWEGFWFSKTVLKPSVTFRSTFQARDDDIFLASTMKTGTTWLKALVGCIMQNQQITQLDSHDLLTKKMPHSVIPTIEAVGYQSEPLSFDAYDASVARVLHTHLPYSILPDSLKNSKTKIVYIARNPKDTLISIWHFFNSWMRPNEEPIPLDKVVDNFCSGIHMYGPYFEHVAGYWEESKKRPEKILFIKYEELKSEPEKNVMRIAEFMGRPFGDEVEATQVVQRCSAGRLKNLEVNKQGRFFAEIPNQLFIRKGEVGDWKNYLTPQMEMKIDQMSRIKLEPIGLFF